MGNIISQKIKAALFGYLKMCQFHANFSQGYEKDFEEVEKPITQDARFEFSYIIFSAIWKIMIFNGHVLSYRLFPNMLYHYYKIHSGRERYEPLTFHNIRQCLLDIIVPSSDVHFGPHCQRRSITLRERKTYFATIKTNRVALHTRYYVLCINVMLFYMSCQSEWFF